MSGYFAGLIRQTGMVRPGLRAASSLPASPAPSGASEPLEQEVTVDAALPPPPPAAMPVHDAAPPPPPPAVAPPGVEPIHDERIVDPVPAPAVPPPPSTPSDRRDPAPPTWIDVNAETAAATPPSAPQPTPSPRVTAKPAAGELVPPSLPRVSPPLVEPAQIAKEASAPPVAHSFAEVLAEARRWVSATPTPEEAARPLERDATETIHSFAARPFRRVDRASPAGLEAEEQMHLSIGTITVTVEDPMPAPAPARREALRAEPDPRAWVRRHYLRPS